MSAQNSHELDPDAVEVGALVHHHMWRQRISQAEMGHVVGVSQPVMSKKLRGVTPITTAELMRIARRLGVAPGDLLPRLDSNQQPSGYLSAQVTSLHAHRRGRVARSLYRLAVAS